MLCYRSTFALIQKHLPNDQAPMYRTLGFCIIAIKMVVPYLEVWFAGHFSQKWKSRNFQNFFQGECSETGKPWTLLDVMVESV